MVRAVAKKVVNCCDIQKFGVFSIYLFLFLQIYNNINIGFIKIFNKCIKPNKYLNVFFLNK